MRAALQSGVTTARSAGVSSYVDVGLRELVKKGFLAGPDLLAAGYHVRTMPAPELFLSDPDLGDLMGGVTTVEALRRVVRANLSHGVDWIKVTATESIRPSFTTSVCRSCAVPVTTLTRFAFTKAMRPAGVPGWADKAAAAIKPTPRAKVGDRMPSIVALAKSRLKQSGIGRSGP